jgi:hypothetical protein
MLGKKCEAMDSRFRVGGYFDVVFIRDSR